MAFIGRRNDASRSCRHDKRQERQVPTPPVSDPSPSKTEHLGFNVGTVYGFPASVKQYENVLELTQESLTPAKHESYFDTKGVCLQVRR